ncbi:MAG: hypothetical protein L6Q70_13005, partial [Thauera sp.]|nr:hypothetical protein [Thauera sp.]
DHLLERFGYGLLIKTHRVFLENRYTRRRVEAAESYRSGAPDSSAFCAGFLAAAAPHRIFSAPP